MTEDTSGFDLGAIYGTTILDESAQPFIVINYHKLVWTLVNNINEAGKDIVIKPFQSGTVGPDQHHFMFRFTPGVFTDVPTLDGWDVAEERDAHGAIKFLYLALSGGENLSIPPKGGLHQTPLTYTGAIQEDTNSSLVRVMITTGGNVYIDKQEIPPTSFGPFQLTLVQANPNTPTLSAPPISVDFVGRRTLLNDGKTPNSFTFALTNMTQAALTLTPPTGEATATKTKFTVWFDVANSNSTEGNPWALTRADKLSLNDVHLEPNPPSSDWIATPLAMAKPSKDTAVSRVWEITVTRNVDLQPQVPVYFTFSGITTDLDPGVTRMYLRFENVTTFRPGVLIGELEKTPLQYGAACGKGLYISAGKLEGDTPPLVKQDSGLYVHQFGSDPAAIFNGGNVGIGAETPPAARLQIVDDNRLPNEAGTLMLGPGNLQKGVTLRLGCQPTYSWIQSHGDQPLAINPLINNNVGVKTTIPGSPLSVAGGMAIGKTYAEKPNVIADNQIAVEGRIGVGTTTPGSSLSVVGGVGVGKSYAQKDTTIGENNLAVEGKLGIGVATPGSSLSVAGGVAIGKSYAQKNTTVADNYLAVEGRVGIGTQSPDHQLHVKSATGIKLSLEGNGGGQLFLSNANNDNSVQLVATGKDDTPNNHTAASLMWLGGWASPNPTLPKMVLNATEIDIEAETTAVNGNLTMSGSGPTSSVLEFGAGETKEISAGKIGYKRFTNYALDIVGAGTVAGDRHIMLFDNIWVPGNIWQYINYYKKYMALWPSGSSTGAWYNNGAQSDLRLKTDIKTLSSPLDKVRRLSGVSFRWTEDALQHFTKDVGNRFCAGPDATEEEHHAAQQEERDRRRNELATPQVGVIAQEVEAVLPEAVTTADDGYKSVNYNQLIALLIEAIKEQDATLTQQQREIEQLKHALLKPRDKRASVVATGRR